jgi:hypothetical protein
MLRMVFTRSSGNFSGGHYPAVLSKMDCICSEEYIDLQLETCTAKD